MASNPNIKRRKSGYRRHVTLFVTAVSWWLWLVVIALILAFNESAGNVVPFNTALPLDDIWSRVDLVTGFESFNQNSVDWMTVAGAVFVTRVFAHEKNRDWRRNASLTGLALPFLRAAASDGLSGLFLMLQMYLFCPLGTLLNLGSLFSGNMDGESFQDNGFYFTALFLWVYGCGAVFLAGRVSSAFKRPEMLSAEARTDNW